MEKEQEEMQFLGFFGIYKESYKTILSHRKIFTKITLTLILPLSYIFLLHTQLSNTFSTNILLTTMELAGTPPDTPRHQSLSHKINSEWAAFILFNILYILIVFLLSLLSTSAVVYTVAAVYTAADDRPLTLKKVMSVVPKVWKRLMVTFLSTFAAILGYNLAAALVMAILAALTLLIDSSGGVAMWVIVGLSVVYLAGYVYLQVIWELGSVVSVMEECYGFRALRKSRELIKGKTWLAVFMLFTLSVCYGLVQFLLFNKVADVEGGLVVRTVYGVVGLFLFSVLCLFWTVIRTVLYFVCKSYHHDTIDKSVLRDHLQAYEGVYEPLTTKHVSLHKYQQV